MVPDVENAGRFPLLSSSEYFPDYDFGMELLEEMTAAGFQESFLLCYYSRYWGYLNENVVFVARRL